MKSKALSCTRCNLHMTRKNVVWGSGPINSKVKLIGEAPGANEDEAGSPFCGRTGIYLTGTLIRLSGLKEIRKLIIELDKLITKRNTLEAEIERLRKGEHLSFYPEH